MQSFQNFHFFFNFISPCAVLNHSVVSNSLRPHGLHCPARLYCPWNSPGNTGLGFHALLQGIFPTQGLNPGLLHCRWILYCLSHQGSPIILKWVASPFSRGTSQSRNQTQVSCTARGFFTSWATWEAPKMYIQIKKKMQVVSSGGRLLSRRYLSRNL